METSGKGGEKKWGKINVRSGKTGKK